MTIQVRKYARFVYSIFNFGIDVSTGNSVDVFSEINFDVSNCSILFPSWVIGHSFSSSSSSELETTSARKGKVNSISTEQKKLTDPVSVSDSKSPKEKYRVKTVVQCAHYKVYRSKNSKKISIHAMKLRETMVSS